MLQHPLRSDVYDTAVKRIQTLAKLDADETAIAYLSESPAEHPMFRDSIQRMVAFNMSEEARSGLLFILNALKYVRRYFHVAVVVTAVCWSTGRVR